MKKSKFTEPQIIFALKQVESGSWVAECCEAKFGIDVISLRHRKKSQPESLSADCNRDL